MTPRTLSRKAVAEFSREVPGNKCVSYDVVTFDFDTLEEIYKEAMRPALREAVKRMKQYHERELEAGGILAVTNADRLRQEVNDLEEYLGRKYQMKCAAMICTIKSGGPIYPQELGLCPVQRMQCNIVTTESNESVDESETIGLMNDAVDETNHEEDEPMHVALINFQTELAQMKAHLDQQFHSLQAKGQEVDNILENIRRNLVIEELEIRASENVTENSELVSPIMPGIGIPRLDAMTNRHGSDTTSESR
jgi:hypothetical protein